MKALGRILGAAVLVGLSGCEGLDDLDLGGGGGAGGSFSRGFAFVRGTGRDVYAVDDAWGQEQLPLRLTQQGGAYEPTVSRDGRQVAFVYKVGTTLELRTVSTTGQGVPSAVFSRTSTNCGDCTNFRYPTFSPDGRTLVFTVYRGNASALARVNTDGSGAQFLPTGSQSFFGAASFYPDGQRVLATGGSMQNELFEVPLTAGGYVTPITFSLGNEALSVVSRAVVSPDGRKVAFDGRISSGGSRIFVATLGQQLGSVRMVTDYNGESGVEDRFPSWRGNTELGFLSSYGGSDNIYRISDSASRGSGILMVPSAMEPAFGGL